MSYALNLSRLAVAGELAVTNAQALRDLEIFDADYPHAVQTLGAVTAGDGGGGLWRWDSASTAADNTGTVILPTAHSGGGRWIRQYSGPVNVRWYGATGDGVTDDTNAINAALARQIGAAYWYGRSVYIPDGKYKVKTLNVPSWTCVHGDGWNTKIIPTTGYDCILLSHVQDVEIKNFVIHGYGVSGTLRGIYVDGGVSLKLSDLSISYMGSHGVEFYDSTGALSGSYPVSIINLRCENNGGDGIKILAGSSGSHSNQMNAVSILNSHFSSNTGSGASLWGANISLKNSTMERNEAYGVKIITRGTTSAAGASRIVVSENYINGNAISNIYINTEVASINGLTITDNYISHGDKPSTYVPVVFKNADGANEFALRIGGMEFARNIFSVFSGSVPSVYVDFDNALQASCAISLDGGSPGSMGADVDATFLSYYDKFINVGEASVGPLKSITLNGYSNAIGATFSGYEKSDNLTAGSHTLYFPLLLPHGAQLVGAVINGETDASIYITVSLMARSTLLASSHVVLGSVTNRLLAKGGYGFTDGESVTLRSVYTGGNSASGTAVVPSGTAISDVAITVGGSGYVDGEFVVVRAIDGTGGWAIGTVSVTNGAVTDFTVSNYCYSSTAFNGQSGFNTRSKKDYSNWLVKLECVVSASTVAKIGSIAIWYV